MANFSPGQCVPVSIGGEAEIIDKIGQGGQGSVYKVSYFGKVYALKWYGNDIRNSDKFYKNLENNIKKKSPSDAFLWPKFITVKMNDGFGYLMDLIPSGYSEFSSYLLAKVRFKSIKALINAALNITDAFSRLHKSGFSYQDLNDGNFFINNETGDVLICDNDNVAPYGENLGIAGKCRYMAPEVVRNMKLPDIHTDRFSLAVILFRLLFLDHPLEGKRTMCPCLTEQLELKFYGTDPIFIYDTDDDTNRPVRGVHSNVLRFWGIYPQYVRDMFTKAFSKKVMSGQAPRIIDSEWYRMFIRLRNSLVICSCGNETFLDLKSPSSVCLNCEKEIPCPPVLKCSAYSLALFPESKIYKCHTDESSNDIMSVMGEVIRSTNNTAIWGMRNLSDETWTVTDYNGKTKNINKNEVFIIMKYRKVKFENLEAEIILL